jgi:phosphatidylglycerophosphatase A
MKFGLVQVIGTVFGIGYAPVAPGTVASLVALPFAWLIAANLGHIALFCSAIVLGFAAIPLCTAYERAVNRIDPRECVIDEIAGQWLACAFAPLTWKGYALAFALFRLFDITKIWPVSAAEKLKGGLGIMADDLVAGAYAAAIAAALFFGWGWP